jgi:hypothetical protein
MSLDIKLNFVDYTLLGLKVDNSSVMTLPLILKKLNLKCYIPHNGLEYFYEI